MPALFERQDSQVAGVFSSDSAQLTFPQPPGSTSPALTGVLVQSLNAQYQQAINRLYELNGNGIGQPVNVYYVGGRTSGNASLSRVIGPNATIVQVYSRFGNICNAPTNNMDLQLEQADCSPGSLLDSGSLVYTLKGIVLQSVTIGVQANDMLINEGSTLMFAGMDYTDNLG